MPISLYYVDPLAGVDAPAGGAIGAPWKSLQYAFNTIVRNAVDGDQVNLKAGAANVNAASLSLAAYGAPTAAAPLIIRGYTAAANDGGIGVIDCNGATMWLAATYDYIIMAYLEIHNPGVGNDLVYADAGITLYRCNVHRGATAQVNRYLVRLGGSARVLYCYIHDVGTGGRAAYGADNSLFFGNYINMNMTAVGATVYGINGALVDVRFNVVSCNVANAYGINTGTGSSIVNNVVYNSTAGTLNGIFASGSTTNIIINNIIAGWNGVGGVGVVTTYANTVGYNAFYNNTAPYTAPKNFIDLTAYDIALVADPFTNAAGGDFSLTAVAQALLRSNGWPATLLGSATDAHLTPGVVQYGAGGGGGGGPVIGSRIIRGLSQ